MYYGLPVRDFSDGLEVYPAANHKIISGQIQEPLHGTLCHSVPRRRTHRSHHADDANANPEHIEDRVGHILFN